MSEKKQSMLVPTRGTRDPFALLRQMTSELDRAFDDWPSLRRPSFGQLATPGSAGWFPTIDVFERDNRLVTRVDLPGMKKEDVSVEVTDGHLALSGERKRESLEPGCAVTDPAWLGSVTVPRLEITFPGA